MKKLFLFIISALIITNSAFAQNSKPNILWIITDDQRADALACFNQANIGTTESKLGYVESPNIDALAKEGVIFTKAFCNSPACAPSRGSMHTGKYPHHSGIYGFEQTHTKAKHYNPVIPEVMKTQGYNTARMGKSGIYIFEWENGLTWTSPDFYNTVVDAKNNLKRKGHTDFYNATINGKGANAGKAEVWYFPDGSKKTIYHERKNAALTDEDKALKKEIDKDQDVLRAYTRSQSNMILGGVSPLTGDKMLDGQITAAFQNYLSNANKSYTAVDGTNLQGPKTNQPQFIHLGYHFPHSPILPPHSFRERFKDKVYQIPDFDKAELKKLPAQLQKLYDKMKVDDMNDDEKQQLVRDYYAFCAYGDSLIGESVKSFKKYCADNKQEYLIVMACGDHGWHLGEQGISAKFGPYDKSNHTTVIAVASDKKKFPAGKVVNNYVEFVDFAPTFFAAAGIDVNTKTYDYLDGYDLAETVNGKKKPRQYILGEMNHVYGDRAYIRCEDFAFSMRVKKTNGKPNTKTMGVNLKWALTADAKAVEMALYDLRVDANEQSNVAYEKEYKQLASFFRNKLGNIVLGDGRVECDWKKENQWVKSDFALGADDKKLNIPKKIIPKK
ncbi:sulfatase-like hydrolase/transferase [Saccharicrinis aurantiacus]|uniref:sulfatase-like hydrolase/transferase n=1 Tax=Saccharicrinis aurantiacus TaxID=1849719 RepID=UPI0008399BE1|nr:sulfatase-like hydrolase/transferase [Saccharicrinis aurantiacus]